MNHGRAVDRPMGWAGFTFFSRRHFDSRAARPAGLSGRSHIRPLPLSRGSSGGEKIGMGLDEPDRATDRSEEHTSELQSLMRISYAVFCLQKNTTTGQHTTLRRVKQSEATPSHISATHPSSHHTLKR